jgi:hypothetical protein
MPLNTIYVQGDEYMSTEKFEATNRDKHRIAALMGDITFYATLVNLHTDLAVFIDFSGHVDQIVIRIAEDKVRNFNAIITNDSTYIRSKHCTTYDHAVENLTSIKMNLKKILLDGDIKLDGLSYSIREERDYHLAGGWKP